MVTENYDSWAHIRSRNGLEGDLLVSALQKSIRRNDEALAVRIGYEMVISSESLEDYLWLRLQTISVEDVGFGESQAPVYIHTLDELRRRYPYGAGDRQLMMVHAIRYLCRCKKERSSDHILNIVMREFAGGYVPEIPDYAYDMHTEKGRAMGRDHIHFLLEASKVSPEADCGQQVYRDQLLKLLQDEQKK